MYTHQVSYKQFIPGTTIEVEGKFRTTDDAVMVHRAALAKEERMGKVWAVEIVPIPAQVQRPVCA